MTIDISKGVYLTTKEITDYAEKHNLDATDVWKRVIDKFCELGATERDGYTGQCELDCEYSWKMLKYVGVREGNTTFLHDIYGYFGEDPTPITLDQLLSNEEVTKVTAEATKEDKSFQLEVGKIYKSGHSFVKIISEVDGLTMKPFVGVKCTEQGHPLAYVGLYDVYGDPDSDNNKECRHYLEPIPKEHPNVAKIKELQEQINKLKDEMK